MPSFPRRVPVSAVLALVVVALAVGAAAARADGIFVADCSFSHRAMNDPIVFHGMPGVAFA